MMGGTKPHGFTIVEALLFLAISGILLGSAIGLITGKQATTEFNQGIRQIQNNLQTEISHVETGYYQTNGGFTCTSPNTLGGTLTITAAPGANSEGTNSGCQFIGAAIQFGPNNGSVTGSEYVVYPIAGEQYTNSTTMTSPLSLAAAEPCALAPGTTACNRTYDASQTVTLPYGITVAKVNGSQTPGMLGFFTIKNTSGGVAGGANGSSNAYLVPFSSLSLNQSTTNAISAINTPSKYPALAAYNPPGGEAICFNSGSTNQSAVITIGANGNPTTVELAIQGSKC